MEEIKNILTLPVNQPSENWITMKEQAAVMLKSGFLPSAIRTAEQCIAIAMTGKELGIGFMESLRSINVIQGKPTVSPQLMLALANRTGELKDIKINPSDDKCEITVVREGRQPYTNEFGIKEAQELGLMERDNYKKQKKIMFQWRALAANLRVTFPDVLLGLYTPEEMESIKTEESDNFHEIPEEVKEKIFEDTAMKINKKYEIGEDAEELILETPSEKIAKKPGTISIAQAKRFFAIARSVNLSDDNIKSFLMRKIGSDRSEDIPWRIYSQLCDSVKKEI